MPFIDSEDLNKRKNSPSNLANKLRSVVENIPLIIHHETGTKKDGDTEIPLPIKRTLAVLANNGIDKGAALAREFGVSQPSISYFKRGKIDSERRPNPELEPTIRKIKDKREEAEERAIDLVLQGLEVLPEKLEGASLKNTLSAVKTMSEVADRMGGRGGEDGPKVMLHLYAPPTKESSSYPVIDITPAEGN